MAVHVSCPTPCPSWALPAPFPGVCVRCSLGSHAGLFAAACVCTGSCGICPWTQIPIASTCHGAGLSLAMSELPFLKSLWEDTRPPSCHCPVARYGGECTSTKGNTSVLAKRLCLSRDFVYGKDGAEGEILALPTEVPRSVLPPASLHIQQQLRAGAAPGSCSEACWEQLTLSPKALGSREETGRTCSRPGNPCFLLRPGRSGQPQCSLPPRRCQAPA